VLPASSLGYVIMTLLAKFWLHEHVSPLRWLGVVFITAGVGFVTRGPSYTDHGPPHAHDTAPSAPDSAAHPAPEPAPEEVRR
jgi:drug/metabolite transporter (DMT)-like permease